MAVLSWAPPPAEDPPEPSPPIVVELEIAPPRSAPAPSAIPHPAPGPAAGAAVTARPDRIDRPRRAAVAARPTPALPTATSAASGPSAGSDTGAVSATDGSAPSGAVAANGAGTGGGGQGDDGQTGGDDSDAMASYLSEVRARLQRSVVYPPKARRIGLRGEVRIRMRILADGSIDPDSVRVVGEGGNPVLIAGALETVERVALTPPPRPRIEIVAPIHFRLD